MALSRKLLVTLERRAQAADGGSGITDTFDEVATVRAHVGGVSGAIQIGDMQIEDGVTHRMVLRWSDPTVFTHFSVSAERYRVRSTRDPDGRRRWLEVMGEKLNAEVA